ncbi:unnamed protein product [Didymodactylos carnosus]|uniref:Uncharacterized protein n=1 Tax=Didymodactylos carnosus TaxID=1234261 RepID=A0A816C480_9BILA|nr:unnamed protein product [Didymodactylos carnosus]CAF1617138.1 unnamed protein product [Didymodactylos carnosus]CAF4170896.1 unnamed protein product [Didymodactylos carnosus]CAF4504660.1 unnamed protein product [Didymodactylos carnosus]
MGFYDDLFATCDDYFEKITVKDSSSDEYNENTNEYYFIKDCQQYDKDTAVEKLMLKKFTNKKLLIENISACTATEGGEWRFIHTENYENMYELIRKHIWNEYGMKYYLNEVTIVDDYDVLQGLNAYGLK